MGDLSGGDTITLKDNVDISTAVRKYVGTFATIETVLKAKKHFKTTNERIGFTALTTKLELLKG